MTQSTRTAHLAFLIPVIFFAFLLYLVIASAKTDTQITDSEDIVITQQKEVIPKQQPPPIEHEVVTPEPPTVLNKKKPVAPRKTQIKQSSIILAEKKPQPEKNLETCNCQASHCIKCFPHGFNQALRISERELFGPEIEDYAKRFNGMPVGIDHQTKNSILKILNIKTPLAYHDALLIFSPNQSGLSVDVKLALLTQERKWCSDIGIIDIKVSFRPFGNRKINPQQQEELRRLFITKQTMFHSWLHKELNPHK